MARTKNLTPAEAERLGAQAAPRWQGQLEAEVATARDALNRAVIGLRVHFGNVERIEVATLEQDLGNMAARLNEMVDGIGAGTLDDLDDLIRSAVWAPAATVSGGERHG